MYQKFGKVREVDGSGDTLEVWKLTRKAMLPQISFIVGPKFSHKSSIGYEVCKRTNAKLLRFDAFVKKNNFENSDDDTVVLAII